MDHQAGSHPLKPVLFNGHIKRALCASLPVTQAVLRAYRTLLPTGRYPVGVLHLEMDAQLLDVNVHPSKLEVRLSKEKECCRLVEETIRQALQKERLVATPKVADTAKKTLFKQEALQWNQTSSPAENQYPSGSAPFWQVREQPAASDKRQKKSQGRPTDPIASKEQFPSQRCRRQKSPNINLP